jgi:hypothetical protein
MECRACVNPCAHIVLCWWLCVDQQRACSCSHVCGRCASPYCPQGHICDLTIPSASPSQPIPPSAPRCQVGFHSQKAVKKVGVEKRKSEIVNRLNRTKEERHPDLAAEKEAWDREQRAKDKAQLQVSHTGVASGRRGGELVGTWRSVFRAACACVTGIWGKGGRAC